MNRALAILYIVFCFEMGVLLLVLPWLSLWHKNFFVENYFWVSTLARDYYLRGLVSGIGLADITTKRLVDKIDYQATYMNTITGISLEKAAVPMHLETDRRAIEVGLGSIGLTPPERSRIVRIKNTLQLDEVEVSEVYENEIRARTDLEIMEGPDPMVFDSNGNLFDLRTKGIRKGSI